MAKFKTWKPGQLITIRGIVYRIERADSGSVCSECALNNGVCCTWPIHKQYPLPEDCYFKRVSPVPIMKAYYE